jgi:hypothetical protein
MIQTHLTSLASALVASVVFAFATCGQQNAPGASNLKRDHEAISSILDKALLNENPKREFESSLEKVRSYTSVDSAWISGQSFFVKYKEGGVVSWTIPTPIR